MVIIGCPQHTRGHFFPTNESGFSDPRSEDKSSQKQKRDIQHPRNTTPLAVDVPRRWKPLGKPPRD